jgi:hypothetical protein
MPSGPFRIPIERSGQALDITLLAASLFADPEQKTIPPRRPAPVDLYSAQGERIGKKSA